MCLASAGGAITPTGIRIMVSYLDQTGLEHTLEKLRNQMYPVGSLYFSTNSTHRLPYTAAHGSATVRDEPWCPSMSPIRTSLPAKPVARRRMFLLWTKCRNITIVWESSPRCRAEALGIAIKSAALSFRTLRSPTDTPTMPEPARHTTTCRHISRSICGEGQLRPFASK